MRIRVRHETSYRFSEPVLLETHRIRLRPRADPGIRIESYSLEVTPACARRWHLDAVGNAVASCVFEGPAFALDVRASADVETTARDPYDFLLDAGAVEIPVSFDPDDAQALVVCRARRRPHPDPIGELAARVLGASGPGTVAFVGALCREVHGLVRSEKRVDGSARPPRRTLTLGHGACRDVTVLLADALRSVGLPARFTSGWFAAPGAPEEPDLHAWTEVYLPGAGWRGFDATTGLAVDERYVPLAASVRPAGAAPVTGTFRGSAKATLTSRLSIREVLVGEEPT